MDHSELVAVLAKPGKDIVESLTADKAHLLHMTIGIVGEVFELAEGIANKDRENIAEEMGDIAFYLRGVYDSMGIERVEPQPVYYSTLTLMIRVGELLDVVKKHVIYNKSPNPRILASILFIIEDQLAGLRDLYGISYDEVIAHNIAKLTKRYGEKYSDAAAIARADKS